MASTAGQTQKARQGETFMLVVDHGNTLTANAELASSSVIHECRGGFTVKLPKCQPVRTSYHRTFLALESRSGHPQRFGLCESRRLTRAIVARLMLDLQRQRGRRRRSRRPDDPWVATRLRGLLATPVRTQCDRFLKATDPQVAAVHQALARVTSTCPALAMSRELYRHQDIVADIVTYPAAAVVTANVEWLMHRCLHARIDASPELAGLKRFAAAQGAEVMVSVHPIGVPDDNVQHSRSSANTALAYLQQWRSLLSPDSRSYRSLDRTLTKFPRGVPTRLVCLLSRIRLPRPITDRLELLLVTLYLDCRYRDVDSAKEKIFLTARAPQIRDAVRRVAAHTRNDLRVTRQRDLRFLVRFLLDFQGPHEGNIVGLAKKAIHWHQRRLSRERAQILSRYGANTRVEMPPISPPADSAVHHLETVDEIVREGQRMGHCIASMVPNAVAGHCYLFHVEYEGESGSIMVDRHGRVVEARGPRNQRNRASDRGERLLSAWGRQVLHRLKKDT